MLILLSFRVRYNEFKTQIVMKNLIYGLLIVIVAVILNSCGGSGSGGVLGNVPNLIKEREDKIMELGEKAKGASSIETLVKYAEESDIIRKEYGSKIEESGAKLVNSEIPSSVEGEAGVEITKPITIVGIDKKGRIKLGGEMKLTKDIVFDESKHPSEGSGNLKLIFVDGENRPVATAFAGKIRQNVSLPLEEVKSGSIIPIDAMFQIQEDNPERYNKISKVVIVDIRNSVLNKEASSLREKAFN